jgi:hypothetical protein
MRPGAPARPCFQRAFCVAQPAINNGFMKRLPGHSGTGHSMMSKAPRRIERASASVLLAIGAAALVGWLVLELYVAIVTLD